MNRRVVIVANSSWNIWNFRMSLLDQLKKEGMDPIVLAPEDAFSAQVLKTGYPVIYLRKLFRKSTNPVIDFLLLVELWLAFRKIKPAIVLLYTAKPNIYGSMAARWLGIPAIVTVTGLGYTFNSTGLAAFLIRRLYKQAFTQTASIVFHNEEDERMFLEKGWAKSSQTTVIPGSGIDTDHFTPEQNVSIPDKFEFLYIGRLLYDKGIRELVEAFQKISRRYPQVWLRVVGDIDRDNPSAVSQEEWNQLLTGTTRLIHQGPTSDVRSAIRMADVVVLPSYREGLPKTILEAMAMEKPVIVTDVAGCRDTISPSFPSNGYLCRAKDPVSLAEKMEAMIQLSSDERRKMGEIGRTFAKKHFSTELINRQYLERIQWLIK